MIRFVRLFATLAAVALALTLAMHDADARGGGGGSFGSRGMRTSSPPAATQTAPSAAPMQRTTAPTSAQPSPSGGFFNRPGGLFGGGLFGGLFAGFLGAGLFGLLLGHGLFGGIGGFASLLGLIVQIAVIVIVGRLIWSFFQRRNEPAFAGGPSYRSGVGGLGFGGFGGGASAKAPERSDEIGIAPADYDAFERLLADIQRTYSAEDVAALSRYLTPEMVSYFSEELQRNASRGLVNKVTDVKLMQGDLAEAWREGNFDYATVAMKFSLVDQMIERSSSRVVEGGPQTVTEVWTFARPRGGQWVLSAIQQA